MKQKTIDISIKAIEVWRERIKEANFKETNFFKDTEEALKELKNNKGGE